ncbi:hypothetical protein MOOTH_21340 [Moorella thermoacetica]|nr:hypothetical protein MOOTH_21340 [Moorella thermoacetica]
MMYGVDAEKKLLGANELMNRGQAIVILVKDDTAAKREVIVEMPRKRTTDWPRDIEYNPIFEPDMSRMVRALRILLEYNPEKKTDAIHTLQPSREEKAN